MDSIGTVNFEDLFDFSPEPLDTSVELPPIDVQEVIAPVSNLVAPPVALTLDLFAPPAANAFKLSQSVPVSWGRPTMTTTTLPASAAESPLSLHTSVGQLLDDLPTVTTVASSGASSAEGLGVKARRGRRPGQRSLKSDVKTKLERSRQSARECRARKKLRYQYLDDIILEREKANQVLRDELLQLQSWCHELDKGRIPDGLRQMLKEDKRGV